MLLETEWWDDLELVNWGGSSVLAKILSGEV
jgi:hypothetical protein